MNTVDFLKQVLKERRIPLSRIERDLGFANGYIGQLKKGTFPYDRLVMIAEYLNVSPDYLATCGAAPSEPPVNPVLTPYETQLLSGFRKLNEEGQQIALHTVIGLVASSEYIKSDASAGAASA